MASNDRREWMKHCANPIISEFSMCGLAYDYEEKIGEDADPKHFFAQDNEPVTCINCRIAVKETRKIKLGRFRRNP